MNTYSANQPTDLSSNSAPAPGFEQQFINSIKTEPTDFEVKIPKSTFAKVSLVVGTALAVILVVIGIVLIAVPRGASNVEISDAEVSLRATESSILKENGFTAAYYAAPGETSALAEERYEKEDALNAESAGPDFIKSGAIYLFIAAGLSLIVGITLFIKR